MVIGKGAYGRVLFVHENRITPLKHKIPPSLVVKEQRYKLRTKSNFQQRKLKDWLEKNKHEGFKAKFMSEKQLGPHYHGLYICKKDSTHHKKE